VVRRGFGGLHIAGTPPHPTYCHLSLLSIPCPLTAPDAPVEPADGASPSRNGGGLARQGVFVVS